MAQDNNKKKINTILENLAIEVERTGVLHKFQYKVTNDPWIDLENAHTSLVALLESSIPEQDESALKLNNQSVVLQCLRSFINIHEQLSKFSKMLYEGSYSLQLYKSYRKLYQQISKTSNQLYQYQSTNSQFLQQKQLLITQNLQLCKQIQTNPSSASQPQQHFSQSKIEQQQVIQEMQKEIEMLNQMIRQNDEEFTQEIQRYNNTLFQMQENLREYEIRMEKVKDYEATIDELEHKVIRLKEEKYRDDMLIDNMSKKIRFYEKERGGADAFLSPRANLNRKNVISPMGNRVFNQSLMGSQVPLVDPKNMKNYYGERLISH